MNVHVHRLLTVVAVSCVALAAGCTDSKDSDASAASAACDYIEAVVAGDQSRADALVGAPVDLENEREALGGWVGIDKISVSGSAASDIFVSANERVAWAEGPSDAYRTWSVDVVVTVARVTAPGTVKVSGRLSSDSQVTVDPLGQ